MNWVWRRLSPSVPHWKIGANVNSQYVWCVLCYYRKRKERRRKQLYKLQKEACKNNSESWQTSTQRRHGNHRLLSHHILGRAMFLGCITDIWTKNDYWYCPHRLFTWVRPKPALRDWSILLGQHKNDKQKPVRSWSQYLVPLPTDSAFICRYLFIDIINGRNVDTDLIHFSFLAETFWQRKRTPMEADITIFGQIKKSTLKCTYRVVSECSGYKCSFNHFSLLWVFSYDRPSKKGMDGATPYITQTSLR